MRVSGLASRVAALVLALPATPAWSDSVLPALGSTTGWSVGRVGPTYMELDSFSAASTGTE